MNLNDLIAQLEQLRLDNGGDIKVYIPTDMLLTVKYKLDDYVPLTDNGVYLQPACALDINDTKQLVLIIDGKDGF